MRRACEPRSSGPRGVRGAQSPGRTMRDSLRDAKRIVVKVGSTTLTRANGRLDPARVEKLVAEFCELLEDGKEIVCVTSGAIAAGLEPLGLSRRIDPEKTKVGYEIPFNRHFYVFKPPRELTAIDADLKVVTDRILTMIEGLSK